MNPMMSPAMMALMMVAMMLPSITPALWHYHRHLRAMRTARAGQRTTLFAVGYVSVWTIIGLALSALPASSISPLAAAAILLCVGAIQCSRWKTSQLLRCRQACVTALALPSNVMTAWRDGCRLGIACVLSCAAPMAVLFVAGLMDARMMAVITAAITAERVAPNGARIARLTGALALIAGLVLCVQATESLAPGIVTSSIRCAGGLRTSSLDVPFRTGMYSK